MKAVDVIPIRIGPRKNTPELRASLRKASIRAVRDRLAEHSRINAKTWIYVGKELIGTKEDADLDGPNVFRGLFAKSAAERGVAYEASRYPFSWRTGYKMMAIANILAQCAKTDSLPPEWGTLYELSRLPSARLTELIGSGAVHPMMTRREATNLIGPAKKTAKKMPADERRYQALRRWLLDIKNRRQRARDCVKLGYDSGLTPEEMQEAIEELQETEQ